MTTVSDKPVVRSNKDNRQTPQNSVPNGLLTVVHAGFFLQFVCVLLVLGKVYSLERCHGCAIVITDGADMESSSVFGEKNARS